jgi:uncharacterized membrane protein (UPF0127 family)
VDETGRVVVERCERAERVGARVRGLLGRDGLEPGTGLWIAKTGSIHTFFMRFPIDVVFLDRELRVRKVVSEVKPFRLAWSRGSRSVVELSPGQAARLGLAKGLQLSWQRPWDNQTHAGG